MNRIAAILILFLSFSCAAEGQLLKKAQKLLKGEEGLTTEEAANGLKEALIQGTSKGVDILSQVDGYLGNPEIKIPFPPEAEKVEKKLRGIGLNKQVDEAVESLNRAAEKAAVEAKDIFVAAIKGLTITDALNIVKGEQNAATEYLKRQTTASLTSKFSPIIDNSLSEVNATKYWGDVMNTYNKIPFVQKVNPDLTAYVTERAIDGLFVMIAKEELNIRQNPAARVTELLQKVFGN